LREFQVARLIYGLWLRFSQWCRSQLWVDVRMKLEDVTVLEPLIRVVLKIEIQNHKLWIIKWIIG